MTRIHPTTNIYGGGTIGERTTTGAFCDIGGKVGRNCKIQTMVSIPAGVIIENNVFIGPQVVFTNDRNMSGHRQTTKVFSYAKIGANSTILAGIQIGKGAMIGAHSFVNKDVPVKEVWAGVPARFIRKC